MSSNTDRFSEILRSPVEKIRDLLSDFDISSVEIEQVIEQICEELCDHIFKIDKEIAVLQAEQKEVRERLIFLKHL